MTNKDSSCRLRKWSQRLEMGYKSKQKNVSVTPNCGLELYKTLACLVWSYHCHTLWLSSQLERTRLSSWLSGRFRELCHKGVHNRPPQHVPPWYADFKLGALLIVKVTIRNNIFSIWPGKHLITEYLLFLLSWEGPPPLRSLGPLTSS